MKLTFRSMALNGETACASKSEAASKLSTSGGEDSESALHRMRIHAAMQPSARSWYTWLAYLITLALMLITVGCTGPSFVEAPAEPASVEAPLTLDCHAYTFLYVGTYANRWANWRLTVDAQGRAHGELAVDNGPTTTSDGPDPALALSFGDDVTFDLWSANGWGHFVQPYPGLSHGYDGAVECVR